MYNNLNKTNYEELKTYYPGWYSGVREMDTIWQVMGKKLDDIQDKIVAAVENNFIEKADDDTLKKFEAFLGIVYGGKRDTEARKALIRSFFRGSGRIGEEEIKSIVRAFTDSPCRVTLDNGLINLKIVRDINDRFVLSDCYFILLKRIPAHLELLITVEGSFDTTLYMGVEFSTYREVVID